MTAYTPEELEKILEDDFINNPYAFTSGRRNDDVVDAMCICFALNKHFYEDVWLEHEVRTPSKNNEYYTMFVEDHVVRVKKWLDGKENAGYIPGTTEIMGYAINY